MTAQRSTHEEHSYAKMKHDDAGKECPFCTIEVGHPQYVQETKSLKVIKNRTPYSLWDSQGVLDHIMIVPKIHTAKLSEIGDEASVEFIRLVETYEMNGYSLYARAVNSKLRSVVHQHTHLIKLDGRQRNFLFMLRKPWYFRLSK